MNPITCGMAADLLPLYLDGCCSADSSAALAAHMDTCPACRAQYAQLRRDLTPAADTAQDCGTDAIARALARKMRRRKRIRADRARAVPAVLEIRVFRNGAQPCLELAVAAKRIKMGVGAVEGLRRELFGDGHVPAQGAQVTEHERTVGCKYDVERVHPCPSHPDVLSIRARCVQKVTADLHVFFCRF